MSALDRYIAALDTRKKLNNNYDAPTTTTTTSFCSSLTSPSSIGCCNNNNVEQRHHYQQREEHRNNLNRRIRGIPTVEEGSTSATDDNSNSDSEHDVIKNDATAIKNNCNKHQQVECCSSIPRLSYYLERQPSSNSNSNSSKHNNRTQSSTSYPMKTRNNNEIINDNKYAFGEEEDESFISSYGHNLENETIESSEHHQDWNDNNNSSKHPNLLHIFRNHSDHQDSEYTKTKRMDIIQSKDASIDNDNSDDSHGSNAAPKLWRDALRKNKSSIAKTQQESNNHINKNNEQLLNTKLKYKASSFKQPQKQEVDDSYSHYTNPTPVIKQQSSTNTSTPNNYLSKTIKKKNQKYNSPTSNITTPTTIASSCLDSPNSSNYKSFTPRNTTTTATTIPQNNTNTSKQIQNVTIKIPPPPEPSYNDNNIKTSNSFSNLPMKQRIHAYEQLRPYPQTQMQEEEEEEYVSPPSSVAMAAANAAVQHLQEEEQQYINYQQHYHNPIPFKNNTSTIQEDDEARQTIQIVNEMIAIQLEKHVSKIISRLDHMEHRLDIMEDTLCNNRNTATASYSNSNNAYNKIQR